MTPDQSQDAAHLAQALGSTDEAWRREMDHAGKLKWAAVAAGVAGVGGLAFREAIHEALVYILGALVLAAVVAFVSSRECSARARRAFDRSRRLHAVARVKGYPLAHDGRYEPPDLTPSDHRPSPYGYDPFHLD